MGCSPRQESRNCAPFNNEQGIATSYAKDRGEGEAPILVVTVVVLTGDHVSPLFVFMSFL